jgi:hypothetical protein
MTSLKGMDELLWGRNLRTFGLDKKVRNGI